MIGQNQKKPPVVKNPLEIDRHDSKPTRSVVDSLFATNYSESNRSGSETYPRKKTEPFILFDSRVDTETRRIPQQIEAIQSQINRQLAVLEKQTNTFTKEVSAIKREVMTTPSEKAGIYHIKFMEFLLTLLNQLSVKVGEANSWLSALKSKKAKRGSAFSIRSKSKGTQYSLSQEISTARAIQ